MTSTIHSLRNGALLMSLALLLGACSSSDDDHAAAPPANPPPTGGTPPATPVGDSFFDAVLARVQSMIETEEPAPIDNIVVTTPETTEPQPLPPTL